MRTPTRSEHCPLLTPDATSGRLFRCKRCRRLDDALRAACGRCGASAWRMERLSEVENEWMGLQAVTA